MFDTLMQVLILGFWGADTTSLYPMIVRFEQSRSTYRSCKESHTVFAARLKSESRLILLRYSDGYSPVVKFNQEGD